MKDEQTAVFTIASKNYFAYVRTLMKSLEDSNPEWKRYVVVVDEIDDEFRGMDNNFNLIELVSLNLPEENKMKFRYTIMEFNTAVKPYAFSWLFQKYKKVVYLDPDIYAYRQFTEVEDAFERGYNFILTPHLLDFYPNDGKIPDEPLIMQCGIFNLGFIALKRVDDTIKMINWWANKLEKQCISDVSSGFFVDQKWIDLIPGIFDHVYILKHDGYNVAYWNINHRKISRMGDDYIVNGLPLVFFHFSGVNPDDIECLSKYQNRYRLNDIENARSLFVAYAERVKNEKYDLWKKFQYSFATFSDGKLITKDMRVRYRSSATLQRLCGDNPFEKSQLFIFDEKGKQSVDNDRKAKILPIIVEISGEKSVVVYGAGVYGKKFTDDLLDVDYRRIVCLCDNNSEQSSYRNIPIYDHVQILNTFPDAMFIVTPRLYQDEIINRLLEDGVNKENIRRYDARREKLFDII